jgi:hypothetical protein
MIKMKLPKNLGMILLAVFLILTGLRDVVPSLLGVLPIVIDGIIAVAAGILLLLDR